MSAARRTLPALLTAALCGVGALLLAAPPRLTLSVRRFSLPGTVLGVATAPVDGDPLQDLVIAHLASPESGDRELSLFLQARGPQRFTGQPQHRIKVPADACAFLAGDFHPRPGGELVFLCATRLVVLDIKGRQVQAIPDLEGFFDYPEDAALPVWDLAPDLDQDGLPELIVPSKDGYAVFGRRGQTPLAKRAEIEVPSRTRFGPSIETTLLNRFLTASSRLRRLVVLDVDADGRLDLIAYREQGLAQFRQRPDGSFPRRPDQEAPLKVVEEAEGQAGGAKQKEGGSEAFANIRLNLADLDRDGFAELVATRTTGEIGLFESLRSSHIVFRGSEQGWREDQPDAVINLPGLSADPAFEDWNGDGRPDLVLSSYRTDMITNVARALFDSMTITYMIYLCRAPGAEGPLYPEEPDFTLDVDVPLEALQRRGGVAAVSFGADLDGDGVNDKITRQTDERGGLNVALGRIEEGTFGGTVLEFSDEEVFVGVGRCEPPRVVDLDGDGLDELLLEPFGGDDARARTVQLAGVRP